MTSMFVVVVVGTVVRCLIVCEILATRSTTAAASRLHLSRQPMAVAPLLAPSSPAGNKHLDTHVIGGEWSSGLLPRRAIVVVLSVSILLCFVTNVSRNVKEGTLISLTQL